MPKFEEMLVESPVRRTPGDFQRVQNQDASLIKYKMLMSLSNLAETASDMFQGEPVQGYLQEVSNKIRSMAVRYKNK